MPRTFVSVRPDLVPPPSDHTSRPFPASPSVHMLAVLPDFCRNTLSVTGFQGILLSEEFSGSDRSEPEVPASDMPVEPTNFRAPTGQWAIRVSLHIASLDASTTATQTTCMQARPIVLLSALPALALKVRYCMIH